MSHNPKGHPVFSGIIRQSFPDLVTTDGEEEEEAVECRSCGEPDALPDADNGLCPDCASRLHRWED